MPPSSPLQAPSTGAFTWPAGLPSLADVLDRIVVAEDLPEVRKRNVCASIRRFCAALGLEPTSTPASFEALRRLLETFHPLNAGIKLKRWQTIRSDVAFAIKYVGVVAPAPRRLPLSPAWAALRKDSASQRFHWAMSRLARFCTQRGIDPQQVDDRTMDAFAAELKQATFKAKPTQIHRDVCLVWNRLVAQLPSYRLTAVTLPSYSNSYTPKWEQLAASFRAEADAWLTSLSQEAPLLAEEGPIKPLRPASIETYRHGLRQLVAGLSSADVPFEAITSLSTLIDQGNGRKALAFFLERNGERKTTMVAGLAHLLVKLGTHLSIEPTELEKLKRYRKQLNPTHRGLSERPKAALRQFIDDDNIEKLLLLPLRIVDRLKRKKNYTLADARLMQVAVALELLLMRPIRRSNLANLRFGVQVLRVGKRMLITIPEEDVKNSVPLEYTVPEQSAALIGFYEKSLLPLFGSNPNRFLFPGLYPGEPKSEEQVGRTFTKTIRKMTGLYLYPHLMRHFAAKLFLKDNPGAFETVRRVLAHKSLTTTTRSYVDFDQQAAVQLYDNLILGMRQAFREVPKND